MNDRPRNHLTRISIPADGGAPRLAFELTPQELLALGEAHVQWAYLEHLIMEVTVNLANALNVTVPEEATQDSFRRRLRAFGTIVGKMAEGDGRTRLQSIASRIANENQFRQKLAHGVWSYDLQDADVLHVEVPRAASEPTTYFRVDRIREFADRVGEISFELTYPGGLEQLYEERAEGGSYMSRHFVRVMQGKEPPPEPMDLGSAAHKLYEIVLEDEEAPSAPPDGASGEPD